jgi:hypothetical protein
MEPSARRSVSARTCEEMFASLAPVPCVAVEIAPAIVWTSISPRFSIARPCAASSRLSALIVIPPCTRTNPDGRSTSSTVAMRSSFSSSPSVQTMSPKEWPAPATRTRRSLRAASAIAAESSSVEAGWASAAGVQSSSPAQLRHPARLVFGSLGSLIR